MGKTQSHLYEVTYFDIRGRGEFIRLILESQGTEYTDTRVAQSDWPAMKPTTPLGSLPLLTIDGKQVIPQTFSIIRRLARDLNMYGNNNVEMTQVDVILDTVADLSNSLIAILFEGDEQKKKELTDDFNTKGYKDHLEKLNKLVEGSCGEEGYAVGKTLTVADLVLYHGLELAQCSDKLEDFKQLQANRTLVASNEKVAAYLAKRKDSPY